MTLEVDVEVENPALECALEPLFVRILPLFVDNAEGDVLIRRASGDAQNARVVVARGGGLRIALDSISRRFGSVDEIRVEDVEFVPLNNLGRGVVVVIVCRVVLVPVVPCVDAVEIARFAGTILIVPPVHLRRNLDLACELNVAVFESAHLLLGLRLRL